VKKLLVYIIVTCAVISCILETSVTAFAQTSDVIPLDDRNHYGQFFIDNVHVSEKDYYKVIFMDVHVKVKDLALEDGTSVFPNGIGITNENGKKYGIEVSGPDCSYPAFSEYQTSGSQGGLIHFSVCYMVEKEFNNFKVHYTNTQVGYPLQISSIGSIDLTNINGQVSTQSSSSLDSSPPTSNPSVSSVSQSTVNIFEQFMNFLKQIFSQASKTTQSLTSSNKITATQNSVYTEDNYYAQLVPSNIQVIDKGRYNVLTFTVAINVQDLPFDGNVNFEDLYTTLQDENSKVYQPDKTECALNDLIPIIGKQSSSASYTVCYSVDKSANKFSIWYTEPPNNYHSYRVGYLSVDSDVFSKYVAHYSSQPIQIGTIALSQ